VNYQSSILSRFSRTSLLRDQPDFGPGSPELAQLAFVRALEWARCAQDRIYWFNSWVWTYNPKNVGGDLPAFLPMDLFPRQADAINWFGERSRQKEDGLFEKSRDIGFTWMAAGYGLHRWIFEPGYKATFGSRKAEYVDRIGDPDSIFEKIRMLYRQLPQWMLPRVLDDRSMLLINRDNGSILRGEAGKDMGRGGRSTDYFLDEFAFMEDADAVDAATSANADCRIFGSSVNGPGNLFARKRHDGRLREDQIFRFHFTDDPRKDKEWEKRERGRLESYKFASEYDIDYAASVEGICIPAKWVQAAKKLRTLVHYEPERRGVAGGDVGGGGSGKSVVVVRFGALVMVPEAWGDGDTINTANRMVDYCNKSTLTDQRKDNYPCEVKVLNYDAPGVGKGVQDALKRRHAPQLVKNGVNTGLPPTDTRWPDGYTSKDKFGNLKAELWWTAREKFKKSYEKVLFLDGDLENGIDHPTGECIILPSDSNPEAAKLASQLSLVKVEHNEQGKIVIQTKKSLAKDGVPSPDHADALMLTMSPSAVDTWIKAFT
jgi:phage terminase large subunit